MAIASEKRTRVRSHPERASYDKSTFYRIVDSAIFGQLCVVRDGFPHIVPMMVVRMGDEALIHCRTNTELAADLRGGCAAALAITNIRGIVFARSVRYHSVNYDSLTIHGSPRLIEEPDDKRRMFVSLLNHVRPDRAGVVRQPSDSELASVDVFAFNFLKCSAKVRRGGPAKEFDKDTEVQEPGDIWTGWADLNLCVTQFHRTPYGTDDPADLQLPELGENNVIAARLWKATE